MLPRSLPGRCLAALVPWLCGAALAQPGPVPPCAGAPNPDYAAIGELLNQLVWVDEAVPADWSPPDCLGWPAGPARALLAGAGRFRLAGGSEVIAARVARVGELTDLVYWSATRNRWRELFEEAVALSGPDRELAREDFAAGELVSGAELHFWLKEDNPTTGVVFQLLVHERTPDRIVFETVNLTPIEARLLIFRRGVAPPGEFRQRYEIARESGDVWRYFTLIRMGRADSLAGSTEASYRNRAEAYFRYLGGMPMSRGPPAAR